MVKTKCDYCGKVITVPNYRMKAANIFCSIQCSNTHKGKKLQRRINKKCPQCKKTFFTTEGKNQIYCNWDCFQEYNTENGWTNRIKKATINCTNCGKEMTVPPSRLKYAKNVCCSKKCRAEHMMGANNPAYIHGLGRRIPYGKNWNSQRRKAIKRDNETCQECGKRSNKPRQIEVHHIIPAHTFGDDYKKANHLSNLITLCVLCHNKAEQGNISLQPKLL